MSKSTVMKFIAEKLWPWFKRYIWPLLREHVVEVFHWCMAKLKERFKEWSDDRSTNRSEQAASRAEEAERASQEAETSADREKHAAVAQVWREVAEQFRQDNEELRAKIDELSAGAETEFADDIAKCEPAIDTSRSAPALVLSNRRVELPSPSSDND